jgi:hypothetical protein
VRRGLKIIQEAKAIDLEVYMVHVEDFFNKYFLKNPNKREKFTRNVYLVTEDFDVVNEALNNYPGYNFIRDQTSILEASLQLNQKISHKWKSLIGLIDLFILSKCDFIVATHSSNFGRLVYEFMHANDPDPFVKFKSVDKDYYIHGYESLFL